MAYGDANDPKRDSYWDIHEWNLDKSVKPHVMVRGIMGKNSSDEWEYLSASNRRLMVSGTFTTTTSPLSADSSSVSSIQEGANRLRMSAIQTDAANLQVSSKSGDAGTFRVSAIGGTAGDNVIVDGSDQSLSATVQRVSGTVSAGANGLVIFAQNRNDADDLYVSAKQSDAANLNVSAKSGDGSTFRVSALVTDGSDVINIAAFPASDGAAIQNNVTVAAFPLVFNGSSWDRMRGSVSGLDVTQDDAGFLRLSAIQGDAANLNVSTKSDDGGKFRVSAIIDNGSVSAKSSDAGTFLVSTKQGDAGLLRVSAYLKDAGDIQTIDGTVTITQTDAANLDISAKSSDAGTFLVSAKQGDAASLRVSARSDDAGLFRVSTVGSSGGDGSIQDGADNTIEATVQRVSGTVSAGANALVVFAQNRNDANDLYVSAKQGDAANLRVSTLSPDAGTFRVSAIGGTAGDNVLVDGSDQSLSATVQRVSGTISAGANALVVFIQNRQDADDVYVSAKQLDAANLNVSAKSGDGGTFRVSAIVDNGSVSAKSGDAGTLLISAKQGDAGLLRVSSFVDSGSVSAKQSDAANLMVSAKSDSANLFRVSGIQGDGANLRVSALQTDAANLNVSAKSGDAGTFRVSAELFASNTGGLTIYRSISVSASQNVKSSDGKIYGWYAYNYDNVTAYLKFYNVSGAVNLGTDTPIMTVGIPPSAAANVEFPHGLDGFSNGIGIAATSGAPDDNTAAPAASAVGLNLFYT